MQTEKLFKGMFTIAVYMVAVPHYHVRVSIRVSKILAKLELC